MAPGETTRTAPGASAGPQPVPSQNTNRTAGDGPSRPAITGSSAVAAPPRRAPPSGRGGDVAVAAPPRRAPPSGRGGDGATTGPSPVVRASIKSEPNRSATADASIPCYAPKTSPAGIPERKGRSSRPTVAVAGATLPLLDRLTSLESARFE